MSYFHQTFLIPFPFAALVSPQEEGKWGCDLVREAKMAEKGGLYNRRGPEPGCRGGSNLASEVTPGSVHMMEVQLSAGRLRPEEVGTQKVRLQIDIQVQSVGAGLNHHDPGTVQMAADQDSGGLSGQSVPEAPPVAVSAVTKMAADGIDDCKSQPKREDYRLRVEHTLKIVELVKNLPGMPNLPWKDMYCQEHNAQFADHVLDADSEDWDRAEHVQWFNPPFTIWRLVVQRVIDARRTYHVCLGPDWGQLWARRLLEVSLARWYIPSGAALFELSGKKMKPTQWGVWIILVGPRAAGFKNTEKIMWQIQMLPWNEKKLTKAAKRRERQRVRRQPAGA